MSSTAQFSWDEMILLDDLVDSGEVKLGRGNIISKIDIRNNPGTYPIYSSSSKNKGKMGEYGEYMFNEELISWSVDGGGYVFYRPKHKFSVTNVSGYMRLLGDWDYRFIAYVLQFQHEYFSFDYQTKAHPSVIREFYLFPRIPLPEQQKIAAILSTVDDVIEKTRAQIDKLKDLKTGMMQELLTKGIGHTEFKDSPVGRIPVGWEATTVGATFKIKNNLRKPISKEEREFIKGVYPYYGPTKAVDYINEFRVEGEHALIGEDGDHFTKWSTWSMTQYVCGKFNVNNHAHILQGTKHCRTKWFFYYFMHRDITASLTRQGATRYKLNKATLELLDCAIPPVDEQDEIIAILDGVLADIGSRESKVSSLKNLKKALMQDLLTGKVRVNVDNKESAVA